MIEEPCSEGIITFVRLSFVRLNTASFQTACSLLGMFKAKTKKSKHSKWELNVEGERVIQPQEQISVSSSNIL